jgi:coenzyme F420-reducing hydrogenase gamma subunit
MPSDREGDTYILDVILVGVIRNETERVEIIRRVKRHKFTVINGCSCARPGKMVRRYIDHQVLHT